LFGTFLFFPLSCGVVVCFSLNFLAAHVELNLGFLLWAFYALYYLTLEPVAGVSDFRIANRCCERCVPV
jgi:hypothetical protein